MSITVHHFTMRSSALSVTNSSTLRLFFLFFFFPEQLTHIFLRGFGGVRIPLRSQTRQKSSVAAAAAKWRVSH